MCHGHFRATALRDDHHGVHRTDDENCIGLGALRHNNRGRENSPLIAGSNGDNTCSAHSLHTDTRLRVTAQRLGAKAGPLRRQGLRGRGVATDGRHINLAAAVLPYELASRLRGITRMAARTTIAHGRRKVPIAQEC